MPWVKLDDGYFSNGKARGIGGKKRLLHLASACWSATNLSDGKIPKYVVPLLLVQAEVPKSTVAALVACNLWHDQGDHYLIHDWEEYIKSKEQVIAERVAARERQAKSRRTSQRESQRDTDRESQQTSHPPRPDPSLNDLQPPTTDSRLTAPTGKAGEVLKLILAAERNASGPVKNRAAWEATVTARLTAEHAERITRLVQEYPTAAATDIAGYLRDGTNSLRYHRRSEPA